MRDVVFFAPTFADAAPSYLGLIAAGFVCAFAVWQFRIQYDRVKRPDAYFRDDDERTRAFHKRQALRRLQLSCLAGLAGLFMLVGLYLPGATYPRAFGLVWLLALFFVGWACLLALVDAISIRFFFSADVDKNRAEQILLDYKMKKFQEESLREAERASAEAADAERESSDGAKDERVSEREGDR